MDVKQQELQDRLTKILRQAAAVASQLQSIEQGSGTPHYDQIEIPAHEVGQRLSRMVQQDRAGELSAAHASETTCSECRNKCPVESKSRPVTSVDGPVEIVETVAHCRHCRRSFFPQRKALGLDPRESTPGFKRQLVVLNAETRSLKRVKVVAARVLGQRVSTNTIERICLDVGDDLDFSAGHRTPAPTWTETR